MNAIKTALRVCEVFEYFHEVQRPMRLKDLVQRFGYPASSASALLKSMVLLGYLEYDLDERTYFPTMRMSTVVGWVERARFGNGSVLAAMQRLHETTLETVTLGTQSDLHAQYIYQIATRLELPYARTRQTIRPLARSGLGWLLLSTLDDERIEHLVKRINYAERRSRQRVDVDALLAQISEVRQAGYVFSRHTVIPGAGMIGMLIPRQGQERQLALSIHGPVDRLESKHSLILKELASVCRAAGTLGPGLQAAASPLLTASFSKTKKRGFKTEGRDLPTL